LFSIAKCSRASDGVPSGSPVAPGGPALNAPSASRSCNTIRAETYSPVSVESATPGGVALVARVRIVHLGSTDARATLLTTNARVAVTGPVARLVSSITHRLGTTCHVEPAGSSSVHAGDAPRFHWKLAP